MWPDHPMCHGERPRFAETGVVWRPPRRMDPYDYPFRTCSYCGSIHPEDLLSALQGGATLGGSDWKYSYPHKFYVEGIPNPIAGQIVECGSRSWTDRLCPTCGAAYGHDRPTACTCGEPYSAGWAFGAQHRAPMMEPAPRLTHAKWYNEHLLDLSDAAFAILAPVLLKHSDIEFTREDGQLKWRAPRWGHQR
jgi:hypothetical protein